jgi:preprotein translocase subunit YajC
MQPNEWTPPPIPASQPAAAPARRRRGVVLGAGLVGAGVVAGAIIGGTVLSDAATSSPTPGSSSPAPGSSSSTSQPQDRHGPGLPLSGTVTAVGSSTVTIKTSSATTTYQVDSNSDIDKNGEAQLSSLKVGDAVRFSVKNGNLIDILHAGDEALNRPQGHGPGHGHGLPLSGTVTAVGSSTVTIKTSSATITYQVDSNSDIDKNGEAQLSSLKVGDAVRFSVKDGNLIDILHAGDEALNRPPGPGPDDSGG